jgi:hypothetical protein
MVNARAVGCARPAEEQVLLHLIYWGEGHKQDSCDAARRASKIGVAFAVLHRIFHSPST